MKLAAEIGLGPARVRRMFGGSETEVVPQTRLSGPMPWVIAIMVALPVIAMAAGLTLRNMANSATAELEGGITVQIVEARPEIRQAEAAAAEEALGAMPGVVSLRLVPQDEVDALIEPWLGAGAQAGLGEQVNDFDRIAVRPECIARGEQHRGRQCDGQQRHQCDRQPL